MHYWQPLTSKAGERHDLSPRSAHLSSCIGLINRQCGIERRRCIGQDGVEVNHHAGLVVNGLQSGGRMDVRRSSSIERGNLVHEGVSC